MMKDQERASKVVGGRLAHEVRASDNSMALATTRPSLPPRTSAD
jgi:hypothetical protein